MNPPFTVDDICAKKTREDGTIAYQFARTKAAKAICAKMQLAIEVFDSREDKPEIWYYADGYYHPGGAQLIGYFLDEVAQDLSDSENINDVLRRVRGKLRIHPIEFDITKSYLVGCQEGVTLDLQTGKARKAAPMDLISMPIPVKYDPAAKCPEFLKFLTDITATDDDRLSIIDFLASLLVAAPMDFFVAAPGLGSNDRSKLKDFVRAFIGSDACRSIPLKDLGNRFTSGFLTRCRVNFCNETEINSVMLEFIKRSSEKMPVEQKFKGMVNMLLYLKFFFDTNTMPAISDNSYGAERRLCRWDMPWRFVDTVDNESPMEKQRDPDIIDKITTPEELSGVLNMVLERAPEVIKQRMIHHRAGGLQEYALQSRSGDVFIELFLTPMVKEDDKVHTDTIRTEYQKYCTVTNSNLLGSKSLKTLIETRLARQLERNVRIGESNRSGYVGLKFHQELFDKTITTLEKARKEGKHVFPVLLALFPDLENSTNSTKFYKTLQNSTLENAISNTICRIVEKYGRKSPVEKEKGSKDEEFPPEELAQKNSTNQAKLYKEATDTESGVEFCRIPVEKGRIVEKSRIPPVVQEFLADGGQASLQRFLAEFPEAAGGSA
jgi:D5 N terminal like